LGLYAIVCISTTIITCEFYTILVISYYDPKIALEVVSEYLSGSTGTPGTSLGFSLISPLSYKPYTI